MGNSPGFHNFSLRRASLVPAYAHRTPDMCSALWLLVAAVDSDKQSQLPIILAKLAVLSCRYVEGLQR